MSFTIPAALSTHSNVVNLYSLVFLFITYNIFPAHHEAYMAADQSVSLARGHNPGGFATLTWDTRMDYFPSRVNLPGVN